MTVDHSNYGLQVHIDQPVLWWCCSQPSPAKSAMATNSTVHAILNPNTPLAFLPPILADQFQVSCYIVVAGLSVRLFSNTFESTFDRFPPCRRSYGIGSCLQHKSTESSEERDLVFRTSLTSYHGQSHSDQRFVVHSWSSCIEVYDFGFLCQFHCIPK
jgi:hypothetical protein